MLDAAPEEVVEVEALEDCNVEVFDKVVDFAADDVEVCEFVTRIAPSIPTVATVGCPTEYFK